MKQYEERLIDLETRLAFQDDTIEQLNQQLILQQREINLLQKQASLLIQRLQELNQQPEQESQFNLLDERPPHY